MKKSFKILGVVGLSAMLLAACGEKEVVKEEVKEEVKTETAAAAKAPALTVKYTVDGTNVNVEWETDITVSEENYGGEHVEGEGHAHIYVDGNKYSGLKKEEPTVVEGLEPGKHIIQLQLQKNNHGDYGVFYEEEVVIEEAK